MKKPYLFLLIGMIILLTGCSFAANPAIPKKYIDKELHYDPDGWMDYTDYCKYYYKSTYYGFEENMLYTKVKEDEVENIRSYFNDLAGWMEADGRSDEYDFDDSCISAGDYYYICTKEGMPIGDSYYGKFDDYTVYFFDVESSTLFYIHNNN